MSAAFLAPLFILGLSAPHDVGNAPPANAGQVVKPASEGYAVAVEGAGFLAETAGGYEVIT